MSIPRKDERKAENNKHVCMEKMEENVSRVERKAGKGVRKTERKGETQSWWKNMKKKQCT